MLEDRIESVALRSKAEKIVGQSSLRYFSLFKPLFITGFIYAGLLKAYPIASRANDILDLTVLFGLPLIVLAILKILITHRVQLDTSFALYLGGFATFGCYCFASFLFLSDMNQDPTKKLAQLLILGGAFNLIALVLLNTTNSIEKILKFTIAIGFLVAVVQFISFGNASLAVETSDDNYQWVSRITMFSAIVGCTLLLYARSYAGKTILIALLLVILTGMIFSGARQALIGLVVSVFYLGMTFVRARSLKLRSRSRMVKIAGLSLLLVISLSFTFQQIQDSRGFSRVSAFTELLYSGDFVQAYLDSGRGTVFQDGWEIFSGTPVFGKGFGMFREYASTDTYRHPHNVILELLSELGLVGLILFAIMLAPVIYRLIQLKRVSNSVYSRASGALLLGQLAISLVSGDLGTNRLLFFYSSLFLIATTLSRPDVSKS